MAQLTVRPGFIDKVKKLHGITSDAALANAIGVSHRTITRVKSNPTSIQSDAIAGFCIVFGYSPSDVVEVAITNSQVKA